MDSLHGRKQLFYPTTNVSGRKFVKYGTRLKLALSMNPFLTAGVFGAVVIQFRIIYELAFREPQYGGAVIHGKYTVFRPDDPFVRKYEIPASGNN